MEWTERSLIHSARTTRGWVTASRAAGASTCVVGRGGAVVAITLPPGSWRRGTPRRPRSGRMKISSRVSLWGVSSYSTSPAAAARVPICSAVAPVTATTSPSSPLTCTPSAASTSRRRGTSGVRTLMLGSPACAFSSSLDTSAMRRPRPMITKWSAMSAISAMRCDETNTVRPSRARPWSSARIHRMPSGSRPFIGSSSITVSGSPRSADAMPSRWPMPSENLPAWSSATWSMPTSSITSSTRRSVIPVVAARARR